MVRISIFEILVTMEMQWDLLQTKSAWHQEHYVFLRDSRLRLKLQRKTTEEISITLPVTVKFLSKRKHPAPRSFFQKYSIIPWMPAGVGFSLACEDFWGRIN